MKTLACLLLLTVPAFAQDPCAGAVSPTALDWCEQQGGIPDRRPWVCQEDSIWYSGPCDEFGHLWRHYETTSPYYRPNRGRWDRAHRGMYWRGY